MTEAELRKKTRSLETMLSRARVEKRDALAIASQAVKAVKEIRNGQNEEAVETLGRAVRLADALALSIERVHAADKRGAQALVNGGVCLCEFTDGRHHPGCPKEA